MVSKTYSISLEEELVERAKTLYNNSGGKLSPLISKLLKDWCDDQEEDK